MIVNKTTKTYQTRSDKPNENWLDNNWIVVDDNSPEAEIIFNNAPYIILTVSNNVLTDVQIDTIAKQNAEAIKNKKTEIRQLKTNLANTDYQAIKYAEGELTAEEYALMKSQRQAWRARINVLESEV